MTRQIKNSNITPGAITHESLNDTGVTAGEYGSASQVPVIVVNAKGQVISAATTSVAGVSAVTYIDNTKTLNIETADGGSFDASLTNLATETYVNQAVATLVDSSPTTLDTLNELAAALGDDPNFATTIATALGTKANSLDVTESLNTLTSTLQTYINTRLPAGVITMWSGSIVSIPTGWVLCDGTNSTPDLRNRFIVGSGSTYQVGATGGSADATLVSHSHTGSTSTNGNHSHSLYLARDSYGSGDQLTGDDTAGVDEQTYFDKTGGSTNTTGDHSHSFTTSTVGSSATNANLPPYYALAYIMKT